MTPDELVADILEAFYAGETIYVINRSDYTKLIRSPRGEYIRTHDKSIFNVKLYISHLPSGRISQRDDVFQPITTEVVYPNTPAILFTL